MASRRRGFPAGAIAAPTTTGSQIGNARLRTIWHSAFDDDAPGVASNDMRAVSSTQWA